MDILVQNKLKIDKQNKISDVRIELKMSSSAVSAMYSTAVHYLCNWQVEVFTQSTKHCRIS